MLHIIIPQNINLRTPKDLKCSTSAIMNCGLPPSRYFAPLPPPLYLFLHLTAALDMTDIPV